MDLRNKLTNRFEKQTQETKK